MNRHAPAIAFLVIVLSSTYGQEAAEINNDAVEYVRHAMEQIEAHKEKLEKQLADLKNRRISSEQQKKELNAQKTAIRKTLENIKKGIEIPPATCMFQDLKDGFVGRVIVVEYPQSQPSEGRLLTRSGAMVSSPVFKVNNILDEHTLAGQIGSQWYVLKGIPTNGTASGDIQHIDFVIIADGTQDLPLTNGGKVTARVLRKFGADGDIPAAIKQFKATSKTK